MILTHWLKEEGTLTQKLKCLGPGLLMAGAAVGVSHLVQSTRAGAEYGFALIWLVILINILKYPFFEYGHRYAAHTGENLLEGYNKLGKAYLYLFLLLNVVTAVISIAGVTFVTAALATLLFPDHLDTTELSLMIMGLCCACIFIGHYKLLDKLMKVVMAALCISSIAAFIVALSSSPIPAPSTSSSPWNMAAFPFLIALMGWMPAPIELSVWQSLWFQAKQREENKTIAWNHARFDFNFGYFLTIGLAVIFLSLGAFVMHGSGESFSNSGAQFAAQLVNLYSHLLGDWTKPIITTAALCTMFSTTLTVIDAYPRSLAKGFQLSVKTKLSDNLLHALFIIASCAVAICIVHSYMNHFKKMIDLATSIAFLAAPIFAFLNYKLIMSKHTPKDAQPTIAMRILSIFGVVFLTSFAFVYIFTLI